MRRAFLCSAALLGFATVCLAADTKDTKDAKNDNGMTATVTKVDAKNNNVTLQWKDNNGKQQERSFDLSRDVKVTDENGKSIQADALKEGEHVRFSENNGKLATLEVLKVGSTTGTNPGSTTEAKPGQGNEATITNVDPKKGTVTLKMKDKDGKETERTFTLAEDARYLDSTGKVAAVDVFRSGNDVLVVEESGRLKQMQQKPEKKEQNNKDQKK